ncbi:MAG: hypothetical protein AAF320_04500 [Myxococcota bacterium]
MKRAWFWSVLVLALAACSDDSVKKTTDVCSAWSTRFVSNVKKADAAGDLFIPEEKVADFDGARCNKSSLEAACKSALGDAKTDLGKKMKEHCPHFAEEFVNACGINPKDTLQKDIKGFVEHVFQKSCVIESGEKVKFASEQHTVCTSNFSGIQNNGFEFYGMQKGTSFEEANEKILSAAADVMQHGTDTLAAVITLGQKDQIFDIAKSLYNKVEKGDLANKTDFDAWYSDNKNKTPVQLFKDAKGKWKTPGGILDKEMRKANQSRASITQNYQVKGTGFSELTDEWIQAAQTPFVQGIKWKTGDKKVTNVLPQELMELAFFDVSLSQKMVQAKLMESAQKIQDGFYKGVLGHEETKTKHVSKTYARASVMGVQEGNVLLDKEMSQQGFFSVDVGSGEKEEDFQGKSRLYFREDLWDKSKTKKIPHNIKGKDKKGKLVDVENEVALVLAVAKKGGRQVLFVAAHSGSTGSDSVDILKGVRDVADAQGIQNVVVLHDANTNQDTNDKSKLDVETYLAGAANHGFTPAFGQFTPDTVDKVRTFMQLQLKKAGNRSKGTSDHILMSKAATLKLLRSYMISPGPDNVNPTDHGIECQDIQMK